MDSGEENTLLLHSLLFLLLSKARVSTSTKDAISVRSAQRKTIVTMCLVLMTLLFSYFPYIICWNLWIDKDKHYVRWKYAFVCIHYAEMMTFMKPVLNAFVYYYRLKVVRKYCCRDFFARFRVRPQRSIRTESHS